MPKRLFIAINPPQSVRDGIGRAVDRHLRPLFGSEIKFTRADNWHFTLVFLGGQKEENVDIIKQALIKTAGEFPRQPVALDRIAYGPIDHSSKMGRPKDLSMVWLLGAGETSKRLGGMSQRLIQKLNEKGIRFKIEHRPPTAHITLLRFGRGQKFPRVLPPIDKRVDIRFSAESVELMESTLNTPAGADYKVIFSAPLKNVD